jgi:LCP family protein required for cell wall assembly
VEKLDEGSAPIAEGLDTPALSKSDDSAALPTPAEPPKKKRRLRKEIVIPSLLVVLGCCLITGTFGYGWLSQEVEQPMAPTLAPLVDYPTPVAILPTPTATKTVPATAVAEVTQATLTPTLTPTITPSPTATQVPGVPICGAPNQMLIMGIGLDNGNDLEKGRYADVIRVIRADFLHPHISVIAISRDFWVNVPGAGPDYTTSLESYYGHLLDANGQEIVQQGLYGRLSGTYRMAELTGGYGPSVVAQVLYTNFGLPSEYYVAGTMGGFAQAVDTVGGLDVNVTQPGGDFAAGLQHMDGTQALAYARYRASDNDWHRMERQTDVLRAFRTRVLSPDVLPDLPSVAQTMLSFTSTNLSQAQVAQLVCLAGSIDVETDITTYSVTSDMASGYWTTTGHYVMVPDYVRVRSLVYTFLNN